MAPVKNGRVLFKEIPTGFPVPGKTVVYDDSETIDLENVKLDGGFLVKTLYLSIDPYFRGRMRDASIESYVPAFELGEPLNGYGVGVVLRSESPGFKAGDHIYGIFLHQDYIIMKNPPPEFEITVIENKHNLPWSAFIGPVGMPGKTAYFAWRKFSNTKPGEVVFVTAGAGPVGSLVIQLAKKDGAKVIASAGSEDKVAFLKEIGADVAFNYKTTDTREVLAKEGPIDIYWDNVGGDMLSAALDAASVGGRFIQCGDISGYNNEGVPVRNLGLIFAKSLTLYGFIVIRLQAEFNEEFYQVVPKAIAQGTVKWKEEVWQGLEKVGDMILAVQKGQNKAKAVIQVGSE